MGALAVFEGGTSINGLTNTIHHTSKEFLSDGNIDNSFNTLGGVPVKDVTIVAKDDNSNVVLVEVSGHAAETAGKDDNISGLDIGEAVDAGDSVIQSQRILRRCLHNQPRQRCLLQGRW